MASRRFLLTALIILIPVLLGVLISRPQPELNEGYVKDLITHFVKDNNNISNKLFVITGVTSGIGRALAERLITQYGATVIGIGRSKQKLQDLSNHFDFKGTTTGNFEAVVADLDDLAAVAKAADEIITKFSSIDFLVNNAGFHYMVDEIYDKNIIYSTKQGYDLNFGINYLSHFLLTEKLLPLLKKSQNSPKYGARIVQVSSIYHYLVDGSDLMVAAAGKNNSSAPLASVSDNPPNSRIRYYAYANSKLAQILHMRSLNRRFQENDNNIHAVSVCPNWVGTSIGDRGGFGSILRTGGFPVETVGLSSLLNALFVPTADVDPFDFVSNSRLEKFPVFLPLSALKLSTSKLVKRFSWIRDIWVHLSAMLIFVFQKFLFDDFVPSQTSPESYNITAQEALYEWSMAAVSNWL